MAIFLPRHFFLPPFFRVFLRVSRYVEIVDKQEILGGGGGFDQFTITEEFDKFVETDNWLGGYFYRYKVKNY